MTRLLILGCGERKRPDPGLLPAIERYDGPVYQMVRRYLASDPVDPPRIWTLSSTYWISGFIPAETPIANYDEPPQYNRQTREAVAERLPRALEGVDELYIHVNSLYLRAYILPNRHLIPDGVRVGVNYRNTVHRHGALYRWLYTGREDAP